MASDKKRLIIYLNTKDIELLEKDARQYDLRLATHLRSVITQYLRNKYGNG